MFNKILNGYFVLGAVLDAEDFQRWREKNDPNIMELTV